ncbi:MAG: DMT family transporter [Proteobacteria bacterium]|nr:DMT family transporter [Pseudomonadota bacterium]
MTEADRPSATSASKITGTPNLRSIVYLFMGGVLFGLFFSLMRMATTEGVPFLAFVFWFAFGGAMLTLSYTFLRGKPPKWTRRHVRSYLAIASTWLLAPFTVWAFVAPKLPAGITGLSISLAPPLTLLFALVLKIERFNLWRLAGMLLAAAGILLIVIPESSLPAREMAPWVLLTLAAPIIGAIGNIWVATLWPPGSTSEQFAAGGLIVGSLLLLPVAVGAHGLWLFDGPFGNGHIALLGSMVIIAILWCLAMEIVRLSGSVFMSLFDYAGTLAGVGWGMLIFGERHSLWIWAAILLLLTGIYFVNKTSKAVRKASASSH